MLRAGPVAAIPKRARAAARSPASRRSRRPHVGCGNLCCIASRFCRAGRARARPKNNRGGVQCRGSRSLALRRTPEDSGFMLLDNAHAPTCARTCRAGWPGATGAASYPAPALPSWPGADLHATPASACIRLRHAWALDHPAFHREHDAGLGIRPDSLHAAERLWHAPCAYLQRSLWPQT